MPSTDEFHKGIDGGTLKDVSIGLNGGLRICDVCARELGDKDCPHAPATKNGLTPEQMEAQTARGVTGGKASYTVVDGQPYEVSAVFKGAVPGAGFRKAMSLKAKAQTDQQFGQEVLSAYGSMMGPGDLKFFDKGKPKMKFSDVLRLMGMAQTAGIQLEDLEEGDLATLKSGTMVPARITQEQTLTSPEAEKLSADRLALEADRKALAFERFQLQADTYVNPLAAEGKVTGPDVDFLKLAFVQAAMDDKFSPVTLEVGGEKLSRVEVLKKANAGRVKNPLLNGQAITSKDDLPEGLSILPSQDAITSPDGEMSLERRRELLGYTDVGTSIASTLSK